MVDLPRDERAAGARPDARIGARDGALRTTCRPRPLPRPVPPRRRALAVVLAAGDGRRRSSRDHPAIPRSSCSRSPTATAATSACSSSTSATPGVCEIALPRPGARSSPAGAMAAGCSPRRCAAPGAPGVARVHVHTCSLDHPAALPAYLRAGFTAYERAFESFPDPRLARPPAERRRASGAAGRHAKLRVAAAGQLT